MLDSFPHDKAAFTQGLYYEQQRGTLVESTGWYGASSIRRVKLDSGVVVQQERLPEAEQALKHALKLDLNDAPLLIEVGQTFASFSAWPTTETCARRALVLAPAAAAHKLLGDVLAEQRRYDEAAASLLDALAAAEGDVEIKASLRKVYTAMGKPGEASQYA